MKKGSGSGKCKTIYAIIVVICCYLEREKTKISNFIWIISLFEISTPILSATLQQVPHLKAPKLKFTGSAY